MQDERRKLLIKAAIGDNADDFFNSDLGQYVIERSLSSVAESQKKFEATDNCEIKNIAEDIHFEIRVARAALGWLNDAINEGKAALGILDAEEN